MITEAIHFVAPDGSDLVVMTKEMYEQLAIAALKLVETASAEGLSLDIPAAVRDAIGKGMSTVSAWRADRGLNQSQLARASGVHRVTIIRMESGRFGQGNLTTRERLATALGVPLTAI